MVITGQKAHLHFQCSRCTLPQTSMLETESPSAEGPAISPTRTGHLLSVCKMSPVKSAAQDHLCHSRRLSAVPHTSLCYLVHSACLVEARLFISHWLHDPKEMSNAPESQTPKTHVFGAIGTRDSKQSPRVTHTHLGSSFLEILPLLLLGKEVLRATVSQTSSKTSFLTEIPTAMSRWSTSCLTSSPPSFGSRAAHRPDIRNRPERNKDSQQTGTGILCKKYEVIPPPPAPRTQTHTYFPTKICRAQIRWQSGYIVKDSCWAAAMEKPQEMLQVMKRPKGFIVVSSTYTATAPAPQLSALLVAHISDVVSALLVAHTSDVKMFLLRSDRFPGRYRAQSSMGSSVQTVLLEAEVELQTTTGIAAVQKTVLQFAFCCDFPRRASHVRAPQMLCESPPGLAVFVPELLALCQPREELAVPASLFTDKEPALLMLLSIKRNRGFHSVLQKLILHAKAQQLRMDTENN
ncbi:hypothetical protein Anapl_17880 [Anas platyrhynchos]|uniref:Uncharacterized protein n=1 Tax=Anas platyrhynchos TaxID=8839 RepID=R0L7S8_ANAPL|nr:hypothetical protein Anapl_17880 [Anas platyrhynchos]